MYEALSTLTKFLERIRGLLLAGSVAAISEIILSGAVGATNYNFAAGRMAAMAVCVYVLYRFACGAFHPQCTSLRTITTLISAAVVSALIISISRIMAFSLSTHSSLQQSLPGVDVSSLSYAIPFASLTLILQAILGLQVALFHSIVLTLMVALYFTGDTVFVPYVLATNLVGCISLSKVRNRSAYLRSGLIIGLFAMAFAMSSLLIEQSPTVPEYIMRPALALLGGLLAAFFASGFTPIVEHFGGYVTDLRLIEMATLDHPLLKEISIRAPGTWNHSMVMGMMGEVAEAIGANPVVTRVGAYFHDIGKVSKPLYFVENQFGEENRHDKLSPSMSALIIRSHVKEGIEMAKENHLPDVIVDMIPQHHGTSVIEYFYEKALKEAEEGSAEVDKNLYTYPGPKPQTREAGILMLADGIEAAARTISEPTVDRIQGLVQKMINKVFASGELDECELTLSDLHVIAKCFTRVLHGIHHQRIAYAEPAEKIREVETESKDENTTRPEESDKPASKEDLKRLGLH